VKWVKLQLSVVEVICGTGEFVSVAEERRTDGW